MLLIKGKISTNLLHVLNGSAKCVRHNALLNVFFAQSKIGQFYMTVCVQQNIFRLQIAIDYAKRMQMLQCQYNFAQVKTEIVEETLKSCSNGTAFFR